jgi:hypothetical protein
LFDKKFTAVTEVVVLPPNQPFLPQKTKFWICTKPVQNLYKSQVVDIQYPFWVFLDEKKEDLLGVLSSLTVCASNREAF